MDLKHIGATLDELLGTRTAAVAISFPEEPPAGVKRVGAPGPAGCSYWKRAAEGEVFFTEASDHHGCPVGAHTHAVPLPPEVQQQLGGLVETMVQLQYLKKDDVPRIPTRSRPLKVAVYSPLGAAPMAPDVVLLRGTARQMMMLAEAAESAGASGSFPAMGRPTCAVLPQALESGRTAVSFGCIGNRVYTGAADEEAYFAIPGAKLAEVVEALAIVARANAELERFHLGRLPQG